MVMEVMKMTLFELVKKHNSLVPTVAVGVLREILIGLKSIHDSNIIHGDISLHNILINSNGGVKVSDFGLSQEIGKVEIKSSKGNPTFMAPELFGPHPIYSPKSDIWATGVAFVYLLNGQVPYGGCINEIVIMSEIQTGKYPNFDTVSFL